MFATAFEGIPFVKVKPYLFATDPLRMRPDAKDRLVSFYGHFPDVDSSHPAVVQVSAPGSPNKKFELGKYVGNNLSFTLPQEFLREGQFVDMQVSLPNEILGLAYN